MRVDEPRQAKTERRKTNGRQAGSGVSVRNQAAGAVALRGSGPAGAMRRQAGICPNPKTGRQGGRRSSGRRSAGRRCRSGKARWCATKAGRTKPRRSAVPNQNQRHLGRSHSSAQACGEQATSRKPAEGCRQRRHERAGVLAERVCLCAFRACELMRRQAQARRTKNHAE